MNSAPSAAPYVALSHLDELWFQVSGTRCNLTCHHCFISCSPHNDQFGFLPLETVRDYLRESVACGVREYYFTGGEPFLHPDLVSMLEETLLVGPATVLTNATVLQDEWLGRLASADAHSIFSLEFRVSLDGFSPETNDPVRGEGTFSRTMQGVRRLVESGFLPIITAAKTWADEDDAAVTKAFVELLRGLGYDRPRLKILPLLHLGAEASRGRGYAPTERVTHAMMQGFDPSQLLCNHSRIVTDRGVHVCPILIASPDGLLGQSLQDAQTAFAVRHGACLTCYQHGTICSNPSAGGASTITAETPDHDCDIIP